jgi:hypothetical protein
MGRSSSVFNKKSRERVARSKKTLGHAVQRVTPTVPQAHAIVQANPNAPQNRPPMDRGGEESILERVGRFATNVGRGSVDVGKSYTTDIIDSVGSAVTGSDSEVIDRKIRDRTLVDAYVTSAMEGNLDPAFQETQRRIFEQPGRVVGEVATETAIMLGTMGFGAVIAGGRGAVMAGSKVPMIIKAGKGAASTVGPGKGAALKVGRTIRGTKTFEHRQWNLADKSLTITKGKGDKITQTTKKIGALDRLEIFGANIGSKAHGKTNMHIPALGKIRNFYGLGNTGIREITKAPVPNDMGIGKTQYLYSTAAGEFTGKTVKIAAKTGTIPRTVKLGGRLNIRNMLLGKAKDLPEERVGKQIPGDLGNWARESAHMETVGIKGDSVETVMRTSGGDNISSVSAYGQMVDDEAIHMMSGVENITTEGLKRQPEARKFLMKIGASGELDKSTLLAGVDITKTEASHIIDRTLFKLGQDSTVPLENVSLVKAGAKGKNNIYSVKVNAVETMRVEALSAKAAASDAGFEIMSHPSIQHQATGTMGSDVAQLGNWLEGIGAQSTSQHVRNLAKHNTVIVNAKKAKVTPEEYAALLIDNGYVSPGSELGGTISETALHETLVHQDDIFRGSKTRYARSKIGTDEEILFNDYSKQIDADSMFGRTKDDVATYQASTEARAIHEANAIKIGTRPFGKKLIKGRYVKDSAKIVEINNWGASRKIARQLTNPKTGKKYTSDEVSELMALKPNNSKLITADEFNKHTFNTKFASYKAEDVKSFKVSSITPSNKKSTEKLLATLQNKVDFNTAIRKVDKRIKQRSFKSATADLVQSRLQKLPLEQRLAISKQADEAFKQSEKIYKEAYPGYLAAAQAKKPGKKAWKYKADAHEAMRKDGVPVVKKGRPSKDWKDKYNKAKLEEIQEISETITVTDPYNIRAASLSSNSKNAKSFSKLYQSGNYNTPPKGNNYVIPSFMEGVKKEMALRKTKAWNKRPSLEGRIKTPTTGKRGQLGTSMADLSKLYLPGVVSGSRVGSKTSKRRTTFREEPNLYAAYMGKAGTTKPNSRRLTFNNWTPGYESGLLKAKSASNTFNRPTVKPRFYKNITQKLIRDNPYRQIELSKPIKRKWNINDPAVHMASNFDDIVRVTKKRENARPFKYRFSGYMYP